MTEPAAVVPAPWETERGDSALIATAIHAGHSLRPEVAALIRLSSAERLREEDPFTDRWTAVADTRVVVDRSRFEVDLNRPPDRAVYREPADAWGLDLWRKPLPDDLVEGSMEVYHGFYDQMRELCDAAVERHGRFVLLDIHSYNHRRGGPDAPVDDPAGNPEINIGTGSMDRERWAGVVDRFIDDLAHAPFDGGHLDVRENVRFQGGYLSRWVHETYPQGCAVAIEVKKIYMDEWTGSPDETVIAALADVFRSAVPGLVEALESS